MTELNLYKFIIENNIEYHWTNDKKECWMMPSNYLIEELSHLFPSHLFDDEGMNCIMKNDHFCFEMVEICENCDIDSIKIFDEDK